MLIRKFIKTLAATVITAATLTGCAYSDLMPGDKSANAADQTSKPLTLERIMKDREFSGERSTYFKWLKDGSGYTVLERRKSEVAEDKASSDSSETAGVHEDDVTEGVSGNDIVFYNPDSTGRKVLVEFEKLIPEGESKPLQIESYNWSKDGKWLMVFTNGKKVWRSRSRGDFWILNLESNKLMQLGGKEPGESKLMFAKFSPDSSKVGWVRDNNIFMQPIGSNNVVQLTTDGSDIIVNGNFDWVYEEEFSIRDGFRWSPDSASIAYWQLDTSGVKEFIMINNTDELYPTLTKFPYPKAGEQNSAVKVGVVSLSDKKTR